MQYSYFEHNVKESKHILHCKAILYLFQDSGHAAVDYLIKHVDSESNVSQFAVRALSILVRNHVNYMQKYRRKLKQTETMTQLPSLKNAIHDIILILEGKRFV